MNDCPDGIEIRLVELEGGRASFAMLRPRPETFPFDDLRQLEIDREKHLDVQLTGLLLQLVA